ncbi:hypothetical protein PN497_16820, partial [Sphaerospermopsis kisseleviana CS-549]
IRTINYRFLPKTIIRMLMLPARFANAPTLLTRNLNQNVVYLPENSCKILSAFVGYRIHDYTNLFGGEYYCWQ